MTEQREQSKSKQEVHQALQNIPNIRRYRGAILVWHSAASFYCPVEGKLRIGHIHLFDTSMVRGTICANIANFRGKRVIANA